MPPFDTSMISDGPLDFGAMAKAIDAYDADLTRSERLTRLKLGTHLYYPYMARLVDLAGNPKGLLTASFGYKRGIVQSHCQPTPFVGIPPSSLAPKCSSVPFPHVDSVPEDIWDEVFLRLPHANQLQARFVCSRWRDALTPHTHRYLILSLPDRWIRIVNDPAVNGDAMFLRVYAVESEIDLSAAIIRLGLQNVVHGIHFLNWPVFMYNFFLHLLIRLESVVIEGRGARQGETFPPRIPCPYLLPPTVVDLHLKNISLRGYSLEGMLLPDGSLQRLHIECIQEGALYIPDPMTAASRAEVRESLGLRSFRQPYLLAPPAPTLRYIKLDLRTDAYGVLEENHVLHADLIGGFALLHQLFSTTMACAETALFLADGEHYPFQTNVGALEELDLRVGTQYYGDVSSIWPQVASTLTTLTIQIPEHHTGGFVPYISLVGLDVLSTLNVYASYRGISNTLKTISTWSSSSKSSASAVLLLELEVSHWTRVGLEDWVPTYRVKEHLIGSAANGGTAFGGRFIFSLRDPVYLIHDPDYDHALSVVASLTGDSELGLAQAECRRYHGDTLIT